MCTVNTEAAVVPVGNSALRMAGPPTTTAPDTEPAPGWTTIGQATLRFTGAAVPVAPLTWGQQAIWIAFRRHGSDQVMISMRRTLPVPRRAPAGVDGVLAALATLIGRHSSLRTRIRPGA